MNGVIRSRSEAWGSDILIEKGDFEPLGINWHFRFLSRHPDLKKGLSRSLELARYAAASPEIYEDHFNKYKAACEKYGIADADKWNADEKGYRISLPSKELIILPREIREG